MYPAQERQAASLPMPDLCPDGLMDARKGLDASCLHIIPEANPQVLNFLLAYDEADAGQGADGG